MSELHLGRTIVIGTYRITVIEERCVVRSGTGSVGWLFAESRPHALLVASETAVRCMDPVGKPLDLTELLERLPALAAIPWA